MKQPIRTVFVVMACLAFLAGLLQGASLGTSPVGLATAVLRGQASAVPVSAPAGTSIDLANATTEVPSSTPAVGLQHSAARTGPGGDSSSSGPSRKHVHSCGPVGAGFARCHAVLSLPEGKPVPGGTAPKGYNPPDLESAYALPSATGGAGQTVAIVDAYDDPNAESDLAVYRAQFSLPPCTSANGCFRKVALDGSTKKFPRPNGSWAQEISLDLDMVSAVCPNCHILLVEASNASLSNLTAAVAEAAALGTTEISNSYGGPEFSGETAFDATFDHPAIAITASSGDSGFGTVYPSSSQFVTAVGGTSLVHASNARGWAETAWSGAGGGCSAYESQPAWQATNANVTSVCGRRAVADVSGVADPNTGVSVYDTFAFQGSSGWLVFGGTSVAAPIVASVFALAGGVTASSASYPYGHTSSLFDVVSGSNGSCGTLLCQAGAGWDGPTGLGTADGPGGF
jgi:subtilase family serine protease